MINEQGGVNGRKINFISLDDAYSPPKTVEQVRRLVEQEQVALLFGCLGTSCNLAIRQYCNDAKIPQLSCATGASTFDDPKHFPWTTPANLIYETDAHILGKFILSQDIDAKIGILYQNDGFGKEYLSGLKQVLGPERASMIVKEVSYEPLEPTVDSQVTTLNASGANIFLIAATPKFAAQAIRKSYELGWSAVRIVSYVSAAVEAVMKPAGLEKAKGVITALSIKDPTDPRWKDDAGVKEWASFVAKYLNQKDFSDSIAFAGYGYAFTIIDTLKRCGDDLSRENILKMATNVAGLNTPTLLPGIRINVSPASYRAIRQAQLARFDGATWQLFGELIEA